MQRCILDRAIEEARNQLGFNELKDKQLEAIVSFVGGQDTFVLLPTGYGKSVIYSMLPVVDQMNDGSEDPSPSTRLSL